MLPYKIVKESATYGWRFEETSFALEQALQDDMPASCVVEEDGVQQEPKNRFRVQWKKHEDELLEKAIEKYGPCKWAQIADMVPGKTRKQCNNRWRIHAQGSTGRNVWSRQEDMVLEEAVREMGQNDWTLVAKAVTGKTNRQCRERFKNYVDPGLNRSLYTEEEDAFIVASANLGHGWTKIAASLVGRTDAHVKLRFHQLSRESKVENTSVRKEKKATAQLEECLTKDLHVLNTNDFLDEDALQSLTVSPEQPLPDKGKERTFTARIVKRVKHTDNFRFIVTTLEPFGKVHANNSHNFQAINKRIRGKGLNTFDLLCREAGVP